MLAALREAYAAVGDPFTTGAYARWRTEQLERDRAARRPRRLPIWGTISGRFGTWDAACEKALSS